MGMKFLLRKWGEPQLAVYRGEEETLRLARF